MSLVGQICAARRGQPVADPSSSDCKTGATQIRIVPACLVRVSHRLTPTKIAKLVPFLTLFPGIIQSGECTI